MQINCPKCSKKFEVKDDLIPAEGRNLICGKCQYNWFFKRKENLSKIKENISKNIKIENAEPIKEKKIQFKKINPTIVEKNNNINNIKFINLFLVGIISFAALIILLDTFKNPISNFYPNSDLLLNHLFETLKDIKLFFKDLVI